MEINLAGDFNSGRLKPGGRPGIGAGFKKSSPGIARTNPRNEIQSFNKIDTFSVLKINKIFLDW